MKTNKIIIGILFCLCASIFACKTKENPIDNSSTIKVPYVLYGATINSKIVKTNDGLNYDVLHQGSSVFTNSIWALDSNIVWLNTAMNVGCGTKPIEKFSFKSYTNTFLPSYRSDITKSRQGFINTACYDATNKIFYVIPRDPDILLTNNGFGHIDSFDLATFSASGGTQGSITITTNGDVYYRDIQGKLFKRTAGQGVFNPVIYGGNKPPSAASQVLFISHFNNRLLLSDDNGSSGLSYSDDGGVNWSFINNVPAKSRFLMGKQVAYDGGYFTSIDTLGLYKLVGNSLEKVGAGLPNNIKVWDIVGKRVVYRTDVAKYSYFLGTNKGTYRSEDGMKNWVKINNEEFTALY